MSIESNVESLPGEHPAYAQMRFVCDYCGEAMLSSEGVGVALPVEHGGEFYSEMMTYLVTGLPVEMSYHVHSPSCEWHFVEERGWPHEHYYSYDLAPVE